MNDLTNEDSDFILNERKKVKQEVFDRISAEINLAKIYDREFVSLNEYFSDLNTRAFRMRTVNEWLSENRRYKLSMTYVGQAGSWRCYGDHYDHRIVWSN